VETPTPRDLASDLKRNKQWARRLHSRTAAFVQQARAAVDDAEQARRHSQSVLAAMSGSKRLSAPG